MNPQGITVTGRTFWKYRMLVDQMLGQAVEKMLATGTDEGSVTGKIEIRITKSVDDESGEILVKPRFVFKADMSVPVKAAVKEDSDGDLLLIRGRDGQLQICENQVTMDEILEHSETVADPEDELAAKLTEAILDAEDDPEDGEQAEDDPDTPEADE